MERIVSVCSACGRCSCARGVTPCPKSVVCGVYDITVKMAIFLDREHPSYYSVDECLEHDGFIRFDNGLSITKGGTS